MRKSLYAAVMFAVAVSIVPACASKKFVRNEVGGVNTKVDTLSQSVEQTQQRTVANEQRIGQVDQKAETAAKSAQSAQTAADGALARANAVGQEAAANTKTQVAQVSTQVTTATNTLNTRITGVEAENRRLIYSVTLNEKQGNFKFGKTDLPDEAKARIDQVVNQIKGDTSKNIFIEIEGHTDNVGTPQVNQGVGLERAEAVKRYLYEQHQIPLHKMNVISYGEDKPEVPNNTRENRAQNRRVVIKVLS